MADHEDQDLPAAEQEPLLGGPGIPFMAARTLHSAQLIVALGDASQKQQPLYYNFVIGELI